MSEHRKGVIRSYGRGGSMDGRGGGGRSSRESNNACREVGGVEKMSSTESKCMVRGEECLEGYVGAGGREVNGGGEDLGVSKSLLGEIPCVVIGESGRETFRDDGGAVWHYMPKVNSENLRSDTENLMEIGCGKNLKFVFEKPAQCSRFCRFLLQKRTGFVFEGNRQLQKLQKTQYF
ncbi:hypothetical protein Tco_0400787 [Tanacetum coccineum]